jgi:hypothetical protein
VISLPQIDAGTVNSINELICIEGIFFEIFANSRSKTGNHFLVENFRGLSHFRIVFFLMIDSKVAEGILPQTISEN